MRPQGLTLIIRLNCIRSLPRQCKRACAHTHSLRWWMDEVGTLLWLKKWMYYDRPDLDLSHPLCSSISRVTNCPRVPGTGSAPGSSQGPEAPPTQANLSGRSPYDPLSTYLYSSAPFSLASSWVWLMGVAYMRLKDERRMGLWFWSLNYGSLKLLSYFQTTFFISCPLQGLVSTSSSGLLGL